MYDNIATELMTKIKSGEMPELMFNEYKRFSFLYKSNQSIRMTIDTNISVKHLDHIEDLPFDILEIRYDKNI